MGTNITFWASPGVEESWPVWEFTVTNNGRASATWYTMLYSKDGERVTVNDSGPLSFPDRGILPPGQHTNFYMQVPSDSNAVWAAEVRYRSSVSPFQVRISPLFTPVPKLRVWVLRTDERTTLDAWHAGTNVVSAP
jgi:hypothetical protein